MIVTVQPEDKQCLIWCKWEIKYSIGYQVYYECQKCKCRKVVTVSKLDKGNIRLNWLMGLTDIIRKSPKEKK